MHALGIRKICALLPCLSTEVGHIYHYHIAVQHSVESLGWIYEAFIPKGAKIFPLPAHWHPVLANDHWDVPKTFFFCLRMLFGNISPLRSIFRKANHETIVFLEHFTLQSLAAIWISLWFLKPSFQFWILHRYAYSKNHFKTWIYRLFHWFLERKIEKGRFRILTDSELLAVLQVDCFSRSVDVVPIPHTVNLERIEKKGPCLLWWPGGSMREDKGLLSIQKLANSLLQRKDFLLVLAEKGKSLFPSSDSLMFIPTVLSSEDYTNWMRTADLVLLPYSPQDYAHRTSGIFVESICLGSIPVVSKKTWMAYELGKYDLSELTLDLEQFSSPNHLAMLLSDIKILEKLTVMRSYYRQFHSENGFAAVFKQLTLQTPSNTTLCGA